MPIYAKPLPSAALLRNLLSYDPVSGVLRWRERVAKTGHTKAWNTRFVDAVVGQRDTSGHVIVTLFNERYRAHRLIWKMMTGFEPEAEIDHVDPNRPWDNSWANIREATSSENHCNTRLRSDNTSGHKGVSYHKDKKKYRAGVWFNGVRMCAYANTLEEAVAKAEHMRISLHGGFVRHA